MTRQLLFYRGKRNLGRKRISHCQKTDRLLATGFGLPSPNRHRRRRRKRLRHSGGTRESEGRKRLIENIQRYLAVPSEWSRQSTSPPSPASRDVHSLLLHRNRHVLARAGCLRAWSKSARAHGWDMDNCFRGWSWANGVYTGRFLFRTKINEVNGRLPDVILSFDGVVACLNGVPGA